MHNRTAAIWFQSCMVQLALAKMAEATEDLTRQNWMYRVRIDREYYRWTQSAAGWFEDVSLKVEFGIFGF